MAVKTQPCALVNYNAIFFFKCFNGFSGLHSFDQVDDLFRQQLAEMADRVLEEEVVNKRWAKSIKVMIIVGGSSHSFSLDVPAYSQSNTEITDSWVDSWESSDTAHDLYRSMQSIQEIKMTPKF